MRTLIVAVVMLFVASSAYAYTEYYTNSDGSYGGSASTYGNHTYYTNSDGSYGGSSYGY